MKFDRAPFIFFFTKFENENFRFFARNPVERCQCARMDTRSEELADLLGQRIEQNLRAKGHLTIPYSAFGSPYFLECKGYLGIHEYQFFHHKTCGEFVDIIVKLCTETVLNLVEYSVHDVLAFDMVLLRTGQWMLTTMPDGSKVREPAGGSELYRLKIQTKREEAVL